MRKVLLLAGIIAIGAESAHAGQIIVNFGNSNTRDELNTQALGVGINANDYTELNAGTNTAVILSYDISTQGIGDASTLDIAVTGSAALNAGGAWGIGVKGTGTLPSNGGDLRYDVGETLSFVMTVRNSEGTDITSDLESFGFTGFSAKGLNRDLNGSGDPVTVTAGGQNLNMGGVNDYDEKTGFDIDLSGTPVPYRINSSRSGQNDILQFGQMQFEVIPEPATLGLFAMVGGSVLVIRRRFMM